MKLIKYAVLVNDGVEHVVSKWISIWIWQACYMLVQHCELINETACVILQDAMNIEMSLMYMMNIAGMSSLCCQSENFIRHQ